MRPDALEMLRGVQATLLTKVLPEVASPYLQMQVQLAVGMLGAALLELDDAPAAYAEERARVLALARTALPLVEAETPDDPRAVDLAALLECPDELPDRRLSVQAAESARLLGLLDRLLAWCEGAGAGSRGLGAGGEAAGLAAAVTAELRTQIARRASWAAQR